MSDEGYQLIEMSHETAECDTLVFDSEKTRVYTFQLCHERQKVLCLKLF